MGIEGLARFVKTRLLNHVPATQGKNARSRGSRMLRRDEHQQDPPEEHHRHTHQGQRPEPEEARLRVSHRTVLPMAHTRRWHRARAPHTTPYPPPTPHSRGRPPAAKPIVRDS